MFTVTIHPSLRESLSRFAKRMLILVGWLVCLTSVAAQNQVQSPYKGVIYGTVINQDGTPAKGLTLNALPLGVALGMPLPWTKTNDAGAYRFERLQWGRYTVFAEDKEAGYSMFSTGAGGAAGHPPEVELTAEHPEAEFTVHLPPPAGLVLFHLTNRSTGTPITGVEVTVMSEDITLKTIFSGGFSLPQPILVPSDKDLLLHVTSWGFKEWEQSVGAGKHIRIAPRNRLTLDVQLNPSNSLTARIPSADPKKYQGIHDGKDWRNPCLIVRADGVIISGVNDGNPLPVKAVAAALEDLPDSAWPYGSVVAVQDYRIASSESERPRIEANQMLLEPLLGELGVIAGFRPPACVPPSDQTQP